MIASANRENDAIWIQKLHSFGLLNSSYLPDSEQESLRTLVRYKDVLTHDSSRFVNRIQQSLELINIKFHTVIRDITGVSGLAVLRAILAGERKYVCAKPKLRSIYKRWKLVKMREKSKTNKRWFVSVRF